MPRGVIQMIVEFALIPAATSAAFVAVGMAGLWWAFSPSRRYWGWFLGAVFLGFLALFLAYSGAIYLGFGWILGVGYVAVGVVYGSAMLRIGGLKKGVLLAVIGGILCWFVDGVLTANLLFE